MPPTRLLLPSGNDRGYFAIERFDLRGTTRLHQHTAAGLLDAPPGHSVLGYAELLKATWILTRDMRDVKQLFRREAFNVFAHNRDDHTRNFAFLMEPDGRWRLAPAYDLTFSPGPAGEHTLLVGAEGKAPGVPHLMKDAESASIDRREARAILDEVRGVCARFESFAAEAGVPAREATRIRLRLETIC